MRLYATADVVQVEADENGFELVIRTSDGDTFTFGIHGIAGEVLDDVQGAIGPWVAEGDAVRLERDAHVRAGLCGAWVQGEGPCAVAAGHEGEHRTGSVAA